MPELNPYEAPQSELTPSSKQEEQRAHDPPRPYPALINYALTAQLLCIVALVVFSMMTVAPQGMAQHRLTLFALLATFGLLAAVLLAIGVRYRIGWLLTVELVLIGLPLAGIIASLRM